MKPFTNWDTLYEWIARNCAPGAQVSVRYNSANVSNVVSRLTFYPDSMVDPQLMEHTTEDKRPTRADHSAWAGQTIEAL